MNDPAVELPTSGECSVERVVHALRNSPAAFGTQRTAVLRSARWWRDGRWANLGTLLHATAVGDLEPERDVTIGSVRLMSRPVALGEIADAGALARVLNTWPGVDEHEPGMLQQHTYPRRFSSAEGGGAYPGWQISTHVISDFLELKDSSAPDGPLFDSVSGFFAPSLQAGLEKWLGPRADHRRNQIVIDDRRAAIQRVEREENAITVHAHVLDAVDVYACARLTDFRGRTEDRTVRVENGAAHVSAESAIQEYSIFLMDGTSTWLDQRDSRFTRPQTVLDGTDPQETTALIQLHADRDAGEGEEIEFKEWIPPTGEQGKYRQLLDTVSAFANGGGGRIYIGVDDRGSIQGLDVPLRRHYVKTEGQEVERWRDAYARRLKQNVAEGIAPEIRPVLEWIDAAGRSVLRITVPPGARTPHEVTETREIYVRRGATSRRPTPVEMRSLFYPADSPHTASSFLGGLAAKGRNRLR